MEFHPNQTGPALVALTLAGALAAPSVQAATVLSAPTIGEAITVDGDAADWKALPSTTVALSGRGGVDSVEMKAAVHGDTLYVLAVWADPTASEQHKPYKWDEGAHKYKRTRDMEDRFAVSLPMGGDFSNDKTSGKTFTADVWHWKAARTNPAGIAQDKHWIISTKPGAKKARKFKSASGGEVYLERRSDAGDKLYKAVKYDVKAEELMPRYEVNPSPTGSIADVKAKGRWADGRWTLEMARKLDTGHADDVAIPANGQIQMAIAAFDAVDEQRHSVSETFLLTTGNVALQANQ